MALNYVAYISNLKRYIHLTTLQINYSASSSTSTSSSPYTSLAVPIKVLYKLHDNDMIKSYSEALTNKAAIYCFC